MLLVDLFLLRPSPYVHACESPRAPLWVTCVLIVSGLLYGALVALLQRSIGGEIQGVPLDQIPDAILFGGNMLTGVIIIAVGHVGLTLVAWMMTKGVGGPGGMIGLYRVTAYLLPLAFPLLPQLAVMATTAGATTQAMPMHALYLPLAALGVTLYLFGLFQAVRVTQGTTPVRSALAVALFGLFCFSLMLLL